MNRLTSIPNGHYIEKDIQRSRTIFIKILIIFLILFLIITFTPLVQIIFTTNLKSSIQNKSILESLITKYLQLVIFFSLFSIFLFCFYNMIENTNRKL